MITHPVKRVYDFDAKAPVPVSDSNKEFKGAAPSKVVQLLLTTPGSVERAAVKHTAIRSWLTVLADFATTKIGGKVLTSPAFKDIAFVPPSSAGKQQLYAHLF